ncbi:MAG: hypothetical protein ACTSYO_03305 [Candidatus Ranarchaeia archaeon]
MKNQPKVVDIDGVKVGGQIGENPVVIVMGLFSDEQDPISVNDPTTGRFDKRIAEERVNNIIAMREKTGLPIMIDCLGHTVEANWRYIQFVADNIPGPFLLDAPAQDVRVPSFIQAVEAGLCDRIVFNSLSHDATDKDIAIMKEYDVKHILILAHNQDNVYPEGRIELLEDDPKTGEEGLLSKAYRTGAENIIIDTAVLGGPGIALANAALKLVKERFGWPVGAGSANAPHSWKKMEGLYGTPEGHGAFTSFILSTVYAGCDFVFAGSVHDMDYTVPAIAIANTILGYYQSRINRVKITHPKHPLKYYYR